MSLAKRFDGEDVDADVFASCNYIGVVVDEDVRSALVARIIFSASAPFSVMFTVERMPNAMVCYHDLREDFFTIEISFLKPLNLVKYTGFCSRCPAAV